MGSPASLKRPEEFRAVMKTGRSQGTAGVAVYASPNGNDFRLGLAVRAGDAVTRNRIKRRLRAAAHGLEAPVDMVVKADERSLQRDFQEIEVLLRRAVAGVRG